MGWKFKVAIPSIVSIGYLATSFFTEIVPCRIAPNIPNPSYSWSFCTLNPDKVSLFGVKKLYWGITSHLSETYLISFLLIFLLCYLLLIPFTRNKSSSRQKSKTKKNDERRLETF